MRKSRSSKTRPRSTSRPKRLDDPVTDYAQAVVAGRIVAGPYVRASCQRHLRDLREAGKRGLRFDHERALRALRFFPEVLRLAGGQFEGEPFVLHPSQAFVVGSLFGWLNADGRRRFRRAYIEQAKGNGKSPLAAGIGMYCLVADGEARAEVYAAASKRDQAMVLFRDAVAMRDQSPVLAEALTPTGKNPVWNLAYIKTGSFFKPISSEDGQSGPRPSCALLDEVHEHKDGRVLEALERGFKWRRQPLLIMLTNAGSDRTSVCWQEHQHAVSVAQGDLDDDTTFSYVCALDEARAETFSYGAAMRYMEKSCTCHHVSTIEIDRLLVEAFVNHAISHGIAAKEVSAVLDILTGLSQNPAIAPSATQRHPSNGRREQGPSVENIKNDGKPRTKRNSIHISGNGLRLDLDTDWQNLRSKLSEITESLTRNLTVLSRSRTANAPSADRSLNGCASIIATLAAAIADCSVNPATQDSVFSEILRRVWSAHLPICEVRKTEPLGSVLRVNLPADDPLEDPSCWAKANPLVDVTVTRDYLAGVVAQAKAIPGKLNGILRLHFCVWTSSEEAWMSRGALERCITDFAIEDHHGQDCYVGVDLSAAQDLTVLAFVVPTGFIDVTRDEPDGSQVTVKAPTFDAWIEAWTPGDTLAERSLRDSAPYDVWVEQGYLHAPKGKLIRLDYPAAHLAEAASLYNIQTVAYDRYAFRRFEEELDGMGLVLNLVEHPQGGKRRAQLPDDFRPSKNDEEKPQGCWFPGSLMELEKLILEQRIRLKNNPVLISACMSAAIEEDAFGNRWLSKRRAVNRIDAAVALAMAIGAMMVGEAPQMDWGAMIG